MTLGVAIPAALAQHVRRRASDGGQSKIARVFNLVPNPLKATMRDGDVLSKIGAQGVSLANDGRMLPIDYVGRS